MLMVVTAKPSPAARLDAEQRDALRRTFATFFDRGSPRVLRSFVDFCEQEIVIVEGKHVGERFRCDTQPFSRLILQEFDNPYWTRYIGVGCVQSGKTLLFVVFPAAKTLFDDVENFGSGVPTMDVAADKWRDEYMPTFQRSFPGQLPLGGVGAGSRGGKKFEAITFRNGCTLKFLSGSGGSEKRSGVTLRKIGVTEADKVDVPSSNPNDPNPNPIGEIEGRLASFGDDARFWAECTITTEKGFVARERKAGSESEIYKPCPHCRTAVLPGREHFVGWEDAPDEMTARQTAWWSCPKCGEEITDEQRVEMCRRSKILHRGQTASVDENGELVVDGPLPPTRTFGIRWCAFDNLFWSTEWIAAKSWRAANPTDAADEESTEKWLCQYVWVEPWEPDEIDLAPLTLQEIKARGVGSPRGMVTTGAKVLSAGVDCGKRRLHFAVRDWTVGDAVRGHAFDIDEWPVPSDAMGTREALYSALCDLRDKRIRLGYRDAEDKLYPVSWTLVDAGYLKDVVMAFMLDCKKNGHKGWMAVFGQGQSEPPGAGFYSHPKTVDGTKILWRGEQCHVRLDDEYGLPYMLVNTDHWKSFVRDGYTTPSPYDNGALTHFEPNTRSDREILDEWNKHHRAENKIRKVVPGRGPVEIWRNESSRPNHHLDDDVYCCAAANLANVRVVTKPKPRAASPAVAPVAAPTQDDRPYLVTNREEH
jgi:phage terminase large subunit GpA-like protein